jgi:hypothetical protein
LEKQKQLEAAKRKKVPSESAIKLNEVYKLDRMMYA